MTLAEELQRQLDEERAKTRLLEHSNYVLSLENSRLNFERGVVNTHPAALSHLLRALADKLDVQHMECKPG